MELAVVVNGVMLKVVPQAEPDADIDVGVLRAMCSKDGLVDDRKAHEVVSELLGSDVFGSQEIDSLSILDYGDDVVTTLYHEWLMDGTRSGFEQGLTFIEMAAQMAAVGPDDAPAFMTREVGTFADWRGIDTMLAHDEVSRIFGTAKDGDGAAENDAGKAGVSTQGAGDGRQRQGAGTEDSGKAPSVADDATEDALEQEPAGDGPDRGTDADDDAKNDGLQASENDDVTQDGPDAEASSQESVDVGDDDDPSADVGVDADDDVDIDEQQGQDVVERHEATSMSATVEVTATKSSDRRPNVGSAGTKPSDGSVIGIANAATKFKNYPKGGPEADTEDEELADMLDVDPVFDEGGTDTVRESVSRADAVSDDENTVWPGRHEAGQRPTPAERDPEDEGGAAKGPSRPAGHIVTPEEAVASEAALTDDERDTEDDVITDIMRKQNISGSAKAHGGPKVDLS